MHNICRLLEFNKKYPQHRIELDEEMQNDVRASLPRNDNHNLLNILLPALCRNQLDDFEMELSTKLVWEHLFEHYLNESVSMQLSAFNSTLELRTILSRFMNLRFLGIL